jgi:hypothetical protein
MHLKKKKNKIKLLSSAQAAVAVQCSAHCSRTKELCGE